MVRAEPGFSGGMIGKVAHTGVWITPFDGWGFAETIDGELAPRFELRIREAGVDMGDGIRGWRGDVLSSWHKYAGMQVQMTPRHVDWSQIVVLSVFDGEKLVFSGMAETSGLECGWK